MLKLALIPLVLAISLYKFFNTLPDPNTVMKSTSIIPSRQWQVVTVQTRTLPAGLLVRMNIIKGLHEFKQITGDSGGEDDEDVDVTVLFHKLFHRSDAMWGFLPGLADPTNPHAQLTTLQNMVKQGLGFFHGNLDGTGCEILIFMLSCSDYSVRLFAVTVMHAQLEMHVGVAGVEVVKFYRLFTILLTRYLHDTHLQTQQKLLQCIQIFLTSTHAQMFVWNLWERGGVDYMQEVFDKNNRNHAVEGGFGGEEGVGIYKQGNEYILKILTLVLTTTTKTHTGNNPSPYKTNTAWCSSLHVFYNISEREQDIVRVIDLLNTLDAGTLVICQPPFNTMTTI